MFSGGQNLRALREKLGLTMRDVEGASVRIAARHRNEEFAVPPSRLSDVETKGVIPSIYRMYSLSIIYRKDIRELLSWYGVELNLAAEDLELSSPRNSHFSDALANISMVQVPIRLDPSFDPRQTANIGRMVEQWGLVPLAHLAQFANCQYTYGYIGSADLTMYPILPPESFVQVDESKNKVEGGIWRSEFERPIYFVEMRDGFTCCWCSIKRDSIVLQSHPLSPVPVRVLKYPQEAEVLGQIVGVAMRLGDWHYSEFQATPKARSVLTSDAPGQLGRRA